MNRKPRTILQMTLALAFGLLGLIASASPAAAARGPADLAGCPANTLCFYNDKDFLGHIFTVQAGESIPSLHVYSCPDCNSPKHGAGDGNFGDQMSSWVNNTSWSYCWYYDINYGRYVNVMPAGQANSWVGKKPQDEASSLRPC
ncbi:MAG: peptidase inhibitor family I36 protein [Actinoplanes sp.]